MSPHLNPDPALRREAPVHLFRNFTLCVANINGWSTIPDRPGHRGKLLPRHQYAFKMFRRHHLSLVGLVEHHLHDVGAVQSAQHLAQRHGYEFLANLSVERKSGVGLLLKRPCTLSRSFSFGSRLLVVILKHFGNFEVAFVVGHFYYRPHERRAQWNAMGEYVAAFGDLPVVLLAVHNSILSPLDGTRVNVWSQNELAAMESERTALGALGLFDAWVSQFSEREAPEYTRTVVLPSVDGMPAAIVSRHIDRVSVTDDLLQYGTSMFTTPVGFSDHSAVVTQFIGMGLGGRQPVCWKFPVDALHHQPTVDWISQ